jgi:hypothetical protein
VASPTATARPEATACTRSTAKARRRSTRSTERRSARATSSWKVEALDHLERADRQDGIVDVAVRAERARHGRSEAVEDDQAPDAVAQEREHHGVRRVYAATVRRAGLPV